MALSFECAMRSMIESISLEALLPFTGFLGVLFRFSRHDLLFFNLYILQTAICSLRSLSTRRPDPLLFADRRAECHSRHDDGLLVLDSSGYRRAKGAVHPILQYAQTDRAGHSTPGGTRWILEGIFYQFGHTGSNVHHLSMQLRIQVSSITFLRNTVLKGRPCTSSV